jgi:hypothetical protein
MSSRRAVKNPDVFERRLDAIRGGALGRSPTVRVLAAYAQHTDCNLARLGFSAGVDLDQLLKGTDFEAPFGQSPFAYSRGLAFERILREHNYAPTLDLLRTQLKYPVADARIANLRDGYPPTKVGMLLRAQDTRTLLRLIVEGAPTAPNLLDGAVLQATIGGVRAYFEADGIAARSEGQIHVAEIKSFPKVDGRVDPEKLGEALTQVAIYIHLVREEIGRLGGDPSRLVSDTAMLITPQNTALRPALSTQDVGARVLRVGELLARIPGVEEVVSSVPPGVSFGPVADRGAAEGQRLDALHQIADRVGTAYKPCCLSSCGNARFCRERARQAASPRLAGTSLVRLLPGVQSLDRAEELTRGAPPAIEEAPSAALLARAGRLYDAVAGPTVGAPEGARGRRPA